MPSLDEIVFRLVLARARHLTEHGHLAEQAAEQTCTGAWAAYHDRVLNTLLAEQGSDDQE